MPRVFRQQYTRPIPPNAQRVTIKNKKGEEVPAVRFKGSDGKTVTAPVVLKGKSAGQTCRVYSPNWYGHVNGERVTLCTNKEAAELMLADLMRKAAMGKVGITDPYEEHRLRPLAEHLADYRRELEARGNAPRYVELVASRLRDLLDGCGFTLIPDLSAARVMDWLADLRHHGKPLPPLPAGQEWFTSKEAGRLLGIKPASFRTVVSKNRLAAEGNGKARRFPRATVEALRERVVRGASVETSNAYLSNLKSFCRWLVRERRMGETPVAHLEPGNTDVDRRHDRRELDAEELRRLLAAARDSERVFRGLTGRERYHLYATACGTGFRASGLASLTPENFDLAGDPPTVTLAARQNKSRKTKVQPLPPDLAELLRDYLRDRPAGQPVWGGTWASDRVGAAMLRIDLEAAGIPYTVEGPDGPLFADFHALRHSYLTLGGRAGIDLRTLQELAGHSTPTLTARYSHRRLHDLAGAVEKLPRLLPEEAPAAALRATGTDGAAGGSEDNSTPRPAGPYTLLTHLSGSEGDGPGLPGTTPGGESENVTGRNPLILQGLAAGQDSSGLPGMRAGDRIRTGDVQLGKLAFYR
jgi:integrase/recombinase XerC